MHGRDYRFQMIERFLSRKRVHFAPQAFAGLERSLQIVAGYFNRQRIGNGFSGALFLFHPRRMGKGEPHGFAVNQKFDIDCIGMTRGNCHD